MLEEVGNLAPLLNYSSNCQLIPAFAGKKPYYIICHSFRFYNQLSTPVQESIKKYYNVKKSFFRIFKNTIYIDAIFLQKRRKKILNP
ncbi:hypothetical protein CHY_2618 [Carboxydothermus hydrogenoformans Z-2901]|uniref:Uncharacterized protein n=1 Tax=Carboxydothermus hydrogenoformans (strain ATCC BAA-161 / DSM 6008 / Z-2901) TaxID=246194 RepID=Q3A8X3_CARHZ|nr:hypothetical protein CHY_2618 [Carboxydothermus hydrogenoformans Z-2901]